MQQAHARVAERRGHWLHLLLHGLIDFEHLVQGRGTIENHPQNDAGRPDVSWPPITVVGALWGRVEERARPVREVVSHASARGAEVDDLHLK